MQRTEAFASSVTVCVGSRRFLSSRSAAMAALIVAPTLYFLVPLMLPVNLMPQGLKDSVLPGLGDKCGRGFVKLAIAELEAR
jgi:hypothetical protein